MIPRLHFIDWNAPALPAVVRQLCEEFSRDGFIDLSELIVVTPGGRSGRRFLELLAEFSEGRNAAPRMATPGTLPELLYELKRPLANELTQQFAWVEALRGLPEDEVRAIIGEPPSDGDIQAWLALGQLISKVHRELAADQADFTVVSQLPLIRTAREDRRWLALSHAQERYLGILDRLELWDVQTARLEAVRRKEPRIDGEIMLIGVADMNGTLRAMLSQIANRVRVFVHAPSDLAERFDPFGTVIPAAWESTTIELHDERLRFVDRPADQADLAARLVRERARAGAQPDDVVIGLADESLASPIRLALEEAGSQSRWIGGRTASQTSPFLLLEAIADRLDDDSTSTTCALLRHPDVFRWLDGQLHAGWLKEIDRAVLDHAPRRLGGGLGDDDRNLAVSRSVAELIDHWLKPLEAGTKPIGDWAEVVARVLGVLFQGRTFDPDVEEERQSLQMLESIRNALAEQSLIPEALAPATSAAAAIRLGLEAVADEDLTPDFDDRAVEMLGWLELPLDDAPSLIVCGLNEGFVPSSLNNDMFLPNGLREHLGLEDNRRRYARDAYALSALNHSRRSVAFVTGRRNSAGDPLLPSRLLFATDEQTIANRVLSAFGEGESHQPRPAIDGHRPVSQFRIPRPEPCGTPEVMRVTAFRDYIACPYRFYLKHILRLESVAELEGELSAAAFGTLLHDTLKMWGESDARDLTDELTLKNELFRLFDEAAANLFDEEPLPAVRIQLEQARMRLEHFAKWQAGRRREGWRIRHTEVDASFSLPLTGGKSLRVSGRIDRIDHHPDRSEWEIFDYKTGDSAESPKAVHRKSGQWVDLQLPLYRRLAESLNVTGIVGLSYITLGKDSSRIHQSAGWTEEELAEADGVIRSVAESVLNRVFWPPTDSPPRFDDFACITQEGVFGREALE